MWHLHFRFSTDENRFDEIMDTQLQDRTVFATSSFHDYHTCNSKDVVQFSLFLLMSAFHIGFVFFSIAHSLQVNTKSPLVARCIKYSTSVKVDC